MKKLYTIFMLLITVTAFSQSQVNVTDLISQPCDYGGTCSTLTFGCCIGDGNDHPDETECQYPNFVIYYVTEDVIVNWGTVRLEHCRLEARNGANIINDNNSFEFSTFCDVNDEVTEIVFLGDNPGRMFNSLEEYNATLGINEPRNAYKLDANAVYYNLNGQQISNIDYAESGVYIVMYTYENRVRTKKIIK